MSSKEKLKHRFIDRTRNSCSQCPNLDTYVERASSTPESMQEKYIDSIAEDALRRCFGMRYHYGQIQPQCGLRQNELANEHGVAQHTAAVRVYAQTTEVSDKYL